MKEILEKLEEQKGLVIGRFDAIDKKQSELDTRLVEVEKMATERRSKFSLSGVTEQKEEFSFLRAVNGISTGDWSNAGFEKEVFDNMRKKAMSVGSDTAGGYIVPSEYVAQLIEYLRAKAVVMQMGATFMDGLSGSPIEIPKQTGGATAYWVAENAAITASDAAVGQIQMTPKAVAAMVKLSNRLIRMSNPSAEQMVRNDIAQVIALEVDRAAMFGTGALGEPIGIINTASINTVALGTSGGTPTFDALMNIAYEVEIDNALQGKLGFVFHPAIRKLLAQQKVAQYSGQTDGSYIVQPMDAAQLANYIGYPYLTTTAIPTSLSKGTATNLSYIIFGNWSELIVGQWAGMEIMASSETSDAFEKNQTWIRVIQEVDVAVRHPVSFCVCSDAKTS
jgi:HK97 family phage major capsid protein